MKTDEHVINPQLLFCKLQQKGKTVKKQSKHKVLMYHRRGVNEFQKEIIIFMMVQVHFYDPYHSIKADLNNTVTQMFDNYNLT